MIRNIESKSRTSHGRKTSVLTPPATHRERDEDMQKQAHTNRERERKSYRKAAKMKKRERGGNKKKSGGGVKMTQRVCATLSIR